jgi:hypothetical protein
MAKAPYWKIKANKFLLFETHWMSECRTDFEQYPVRYLSLQAFSGEVKPPVFSKAFRCVSLDVDDTVLKG